jgi:hypothetical protein
MWMRDEFLLLEANGLFESRQLLTWFGRMIIGIVIKNGIELRGASRLM